MSRKEKDIHPKEPLEQDHPWGDTTIRGWKLYNVKLVAVGGGYRKKQGLLKSPSTAH
jgi:hypothetical protein